VGESLPPMNLCVQVALLRGAPVNAFAKLSHQEQQARRSWHLEGDSWHAPKMKTLVQVAKDYGCVEEFWGCYTHLSEVTNANSLTREAKRQVDVAQSHTNYQMSMTSKELEGIISFRWNQDGSWRYKDNVAKAVLGIVVPLPDGTHSPIEHLPVSTPTKTLGQMTWPTECSRGAIRQMTEKAQKWINKAKGGNLHRHNV
jgi:hypothetical protein